MFDGKIAAGLSLKVALDDEDNAKVQRLVEENGRFRIALEKIAAGHGCDSHHCGCLDVAAKALGSPSGSAGSDG